MNYDKSNVALFLPATKIKHLLYNNIIYSINISIIIIYIKFTCIVNFYDPQNTFSIQLIYPPTHDAALLLLMIDDLIYFSMIYLRHGYKILKFLDHRNGILIYVHNFEFFKSCTLRLRSLNRILVLNVLNLKNTINYFFR